MVYDNEIKLVRMVTGEDIIAKVKETTNTYELIDPMKLVYSVSLMKPGVLDMFLMRWCFKKVSEKQEFKIDKSHVLFVTDVTLPLKENYLDTLKKYNNDDNEINDAKDIADIKGLLLEHIKKK